MQNTTETADAQQQHANDLVKDLAAVTHRLVAGACAAEPDRVGMATAGAVLAATDRLTAAAAEVLARVSHRGVIADEGLSAGAWLRTFAARTVADEKMLANAVERLRDMPTLRQWFIDGSISWPAVRGIVAAVRNLTREQRRWLDATLAGDEDRVRRLDADDLVGAAQSLADQAREDLHCDRERRAFQQEFLRWEKAFDGSCRGSFAFGPEGTAVIEEALAAMQQRMNHNNGDDHDRGSDGDDGATGAGAGEHHDDTGMATGHPADRDNGETAGDATDDPAPRDANANAHHADAGNPDTDGDGSEDRNRADHSDADADGDNTGDGDGDGDEGDGGGFVRDWFMHRRAWTNAQAFLALCRQRLGKVGGTAPSPARPSMLLIADLAALLGDNHDGVGSATAQLLLRSASGPVELTSAAAQRLACDAQLRTIFADGDQILGASAAEPAVSASLRAALVARDGDCRFPGCHQSAEACENHHVVPKSKGGATELENLALLCVAHYHAIHDGQWANTLHPDGTMTFTRRGVTLTTLPRAARRFTPTGPPPAGRPTRQPPDPATNSDDHMTTIATIATAAALAGDGRPPDDDLPF